MGITDEELGRWVEDSLRYAVERVAAAAEENGLNPYRREDWGKFYKLLRGKVDVDVRILTEILRNWVFVKGAYEKDFGKQRTVLVKKVSA